MKRPAFRTLWGLAGIFIIFGIGGLGIADQPMPVNKKIGEVTVTMKVPGYMNLVFSNYGASLKHAFMLNSQYNQKKRKPPETQFQPPKEKLAAGPLDLVSTWDPQFYPLQLQMEWNQGSQVEPKVVRHLKKQHKPGNDTVKGDFLAVYKQDPVFTVLRKDAKSVTYIWPDPKTDTSKVFLIKKFKLDKNYTVDMSVELVSLTQKKVKIDYKVALYTWQPPKAHSGGTCGSAMFSPHPDMKNAMCYSDDSLEDETFAGKTLKKSYAGATAFAAVGSRYFVIAAAPDGEMNKAQCSLNIFQGGVVISKLHEMAPLEAYAKPGACVPGFLPTPEGAVSCKTAAAVLGVDSTAGQDKIIQAFKAKKAGNGANTDEIAKAMTALTSRLATTNNFLVYTGPKDIGELENAGHKLRSAVNFNLFGIPLGVLCIPMLWLMRISYKVIPNWGVSILFLTFIVKLLTLYWTQKSFVQMKKMQDLKPEMDRIKKQYKKDKDGLNKAMMDLYKRHKVNPLGGCLPMVIQMPIWFALYRTIYSAVELYQAPLFWWIHDLSAYDPYFVLPVLLGLATFLQQKFTPQAGDASQAKVMMYAMPVMFTVFMLFMPSGLTFYILINSILTVGHQWMIQRRS